MRIEQPDLTDEKVTRACYDVMLAAHKVDEPVEPPMAYATFDHYLREGWEKTPGEGWVGLADAGAAPGSSGTPLPARETPDEGGGGPIVHPAARGRGIGRALLRHGGERAAATGRTGFPASTTAGAAGDAFARA